MKNISEIHSSFTVTFGYLEACQQMVQSYVQTHPSEHLKGISIQLKLG